MQIETVTLQLQVDKSYEINAHYLRGFFDKTFPEHLLIHQHTEDGGFRYQYPLIQYKVLNNIPLIIGIEEGGAIIKQIFDKFDHLQINGHKIPILEKKIQVERCDLGVSNENHTYCFLTPWIALNQKNLVFYLHNNGENRSQLFRRILVGNLISLSKGLKYDVVDRIEASPFVEQQEEPVRYKDTYLLGFIGTFQTNFLLPNLIGIGKGVSKGFGVIKRVDL